MTTISQDIQRPDLDDREYEIIRLENGLEVLLVSDSHTDKAAAALDVHIGNLCDPSDAQGLAHFLEHLLFMVWIQLTQGTEKYPIENEYSQFLSIHSGHSNAFTAGDHTS